MSLLKPNGTRYVMGTRTGHYESFFLRGNHPQRPLAFWIRYTIFSPRRHPENALGQLWAVWFDGEQGRHTAAKSEFPIDRCRFASDELDVDIAGAVLDARTVHGSIVDRGRTISWALAYSGESPALLLLPERFYETSLPRAKSLVPLPMARFRGFVAVGDHEIEIDDWIGSQNHNWGSRHTDRYAWGQVAGFDSHPDAFLEVATARVKLGPWLLPWATVLVLRLGGVEYRLNELRQSFRARSDLDGFTWRFSAETPTVAMRGVIEAPLEAFVGLHYANPPGGAKHCLNSKIGSCELHVTDKSSGITEVLATANRTAFEILTDRRDHGIEIRA